jgi:hypothetical protein
MDAASTFSPLSEISFEIPSQEPLKFPESRNFRGPREIGKRSAASAQDKNFFTLIRFGS